MEYDWESSLGVYFEIDIIFLLLFFICCAVWMQRPSKINEVSIFSEAEQRAEKNARFPGKIILKPKSDSDFGSIN